MKVRAILNAGGHSVGVDGLFPDGAGFTMSASGDASRIPGHGSYSLRLLDSGAVIEWEGVMRMEGVWLHGVAENGARLI